MGLFFICLSFFFLWGHNVIYARLLTLKKQHISVRSAFPSFLPSSPFPLIRVLWFQTYSISLSYFPFTRKLYVAGLYVCIPISKKIMNTLTLEALENVAKKSSSVKNEVHFKLVSISFFCEEAIQFLELSVPLSYFRKFSVKQNQKNFFYHHLPFIATVCCWILL